MTDPAPVGHESVIANVESFVDLLFLANLPRTVYLPDGNVEPRGGDPKIEKGIDDINTLIYAFRALIKEHDELKRQEEAP